MCGHLVEGSGWGVLTVPAFWVPSAPSLLLHQTKARCQIKSPPLHDSKDQISATKTTRNWNFPLLERPREGKRRKGPLAGFVQLNPPVPPPQPNPAGTRATLGSHLRNASSRSRSSSLPRPCQPSGKQESCCEPWSSSPAPPPRPRRPYLDAHLSSLHGLALGIRRDSDVSSLSGFVF